MHSTKGTGPRRRIFLVVRFTLIICTGGEGRTFGSCKGVALNVMYILKGIIRRIRCTISILFWIKHET